VNYNSKVSIGRGGEFNVLGGHLFELAPRDNVVPLGLNIGST
jgi:hypothetical protein